MLSLGMTGKEETRTALSFSSFADSAAWVLSWSMKEQEQV